MAVEQKVIEKIRSVLIADSTIDGYVKTRVYGSHISSVKEPVHPSISLHLLPGSRKFSERGFAILNIQVDIWVLNTVPDPQGDVFILVDRVRALLDRQKLVDSTIPLKVGMSVETNSGQMMTDPDKSLVHYPLIYQVVAA